MAVRASVQEISVDVCVYGGTSGGVIAAVQAARLGKTVALVSVDNHLGGMTSGGLGQTDIGGFGDSYIQGTAREFYTRIGQKYGSGAKFTFEPHVAEAVFREMCQLQNLTIYSNQYVTSVTKTGPTITIVNMNNGNLFRAKMFIDASYEGDLLARAGVSYTVGREANSRYGETLNGVRAPNSGGHQFGSLSVNPYVISNNPAAGLLRLIQSGAPGPVGSADQHVQAYNFRLCLTQVASNKIPIGAPAGYDPAQYELLGRYIQAMTAQGTSITLGTFMNVSSMPNGKTDINNNGPVSTDFIGQSTPWVEADYNTRLQIWNAHKNYLQGFLYFLATDSRVPATVRSNMSAYGLCQDEFVDTGGWPFQLYVREARRMVSDYVMTQSNCLGTVVAAEPVGLAAYAMDSHNGQRFAVNGLAENEGDTYTLGGIPGVYPVDYRSLVPSSAECQNLLVPWCISASHIGFGSIRMEPVFMILSQSAATAACIAIDDSSSVQNINIAKLQAQLQADGQLLQTTTSADNSIVVDNASPSGVTLVGPWTVSTASAGYYGANYLHDGDTNKGGSSVTFIPVLPQNDIYQIYARWTVNPNRDTHVPIDVIYPGGTNTFFVNQQQQNGQWVLLMTTNLNAGTNAQVRIRNTGTTGYVIADAVQFVGSTIPSTVNVWATDANGSRFGPHAAVVTVSRSGSTNVPLTVYFTQSGTAQNGLDFSSISNSLTIPIGSSAAAFTLLPMTNSKPVGDKSVTITLSTDTGYSIGPLASATVKILDVPINNWKLSHFGTNASNDAISGDDASPAGDGISNLMKYALGLDPNQSSSKLLLRPGFATNGFFEFSYTRPDPPPSDVDYTVSVSENLTNWCTNDCSETVQIYPGTNGNVIVTTRNVIPIDAAPKDFMRLKVTRRTYSKNIQGATVVAFGDSITQGYGVPTNQTWAAQLQARFNLSLVNAGISGNTSSQGLARMDSDVLASKPDFVLINFGMNDHVMTATNQPQVSQPVFRQNLMAMIDSAARTGAVPVLVTPNYIIEGDDTQYYYHRHPAGYYAGVGGAQAWLDTYIQIVRDVAKIENTGLVDVRTACDNYDRFQFLRSLANGADDDDGVHPYLIGSGVYGQLIGDYLAANYQKP